MKKLAGFSLVSVLAVLASGQMQHTESSGGGADLVARGKYIVEDVALCEQCHTPRDEHGVPDRGGGSWVARSKSGPPIPRSGL